MIRKIAIVSIALALNLALPLNLYGDSHIMKISGKNRVDTSIETSKVVKSDTLVVASAYEFADALSAFNIASKYDARLILIGNDTDLTPVFKESKIKQAYIIGGENSLDGKSIETLKSQVSKVERIAGSNRYDTNLMTLDKAGYKRVGVANGQEFADALSASGLLKKEGLGLMLVNGNNPYTTDREVVYTFGLENSVRQNGGRRIGGRNRYATSEMINMEVSDISKLALTTGREFADALSAINIINSGKDTSILLLESLNSENKEIINSSNDVIFIGGKLSSETEKNISKLKNSDFTLKKPNKEVKNRRGLIIYPPTGEDGKPLKPKQRVASTDYIYYYCAINDENFSMYSRGMVDSKIDVNKIRRQVPDGYKVISTDEEMRNFKRGNSNWDNKVFVVKEGTKIIKTQEEYERFLFEQFRHGASNSAQNLIISPKVQPSYGLDVLAQGMGYFIHQVKLCDSAINIKWAIRQEYYTKEVYNKDKYLSNLRAVRRLIDDSGALKLDTNEEKADLFAKYLIYNYSYNKDKMNHIKSRSPYSIIDYNTGVCEAFTYTFNQAMFMMRIPSYYYSGSDHMEAKFYTGEYWKIINTTGSEDEDFKKRIKNFRKLPNSVLENTITSPSGDIFYVEKEMNKILYLYGDC